VAASSATGINGGQVTVLREGDKQIPVVTRLRMEERAQLADVQDLYVYSTQGPQKAPLRQVSSVEHEMQTETIRRRNQFRTITVGCMPEAGHLSSEVMNAIRPQLAAFANQLPPGYQMQIGGSEEEQVKGFRNLVVVLLISVTAIFLSLVYQFKNAIKPLVVFAAVPYGIVGGLTALWIMSTPFGFMASLGIISLVGLIVSHIIVLFDFIEEKHAAGEPLKGGGAGCGHYAPPSGIDNGTRFSDCPSPSGPSGRAAVGADVLRTEGGMLCATFITLLLVPVIYSIFVLDLKLIKWDAAGTPNSEDEQSQAAGDVEADTAQLTVAER